MPLSGDPLHRINDDCKPFLTFVNGNLTFPFSSLRCCSPFEEERCIIGDEVDGVPRIQNVAPGFGLKTALKLLKKHGSLENLLNAAAVRTVGRQYAQDALTKYADYLRRNHKVLALRRDVDVQLKEEWLVERETHYDSTILSNFFKLLEETPKLTHQTG
ncbi:hypothetical protein FH972_014371 [Carpinus fangiana]|uniref:5'-3' exonuclease domain-containing protein n=1 Tax=Carpinus fangiana TaxID=176857 RepID=A0A5N6RCS4_9ROSI|nr:hypothetical protein FH972_014371 [Carpinus fangiana]